jgi:hypothetical protein
MGFDREGRRLSTLEDKYTFRDEMVERLALDLLGPADGPDEVLTENPLDRYIVGVLWPTVDESQEAVAEEPVDADSEAEPVEDTPVSQSRMRYPSSLGMTFSVDLQRARTVTLRAEAARYVELDLAPADLEGSDVSGRRRSRAAQSWQRTVPRIEPIEIDLATPLEHRPEVSDGLELYILVRPAVDNVVTVTAALVNKRIAPQKSLRDAYAWFQPVVRAKTPVPAIVDRNAVRDVGLDEDIDAGLLLYRKNKRYAAGHGCATTWESPPGLPGMTSTVRTTFVPTVDLQRATTTEIKGSNLRMSFLATAPDAEVIDSLRTVVSAYRAWIAERTEEVRLDRSDADIPERLQHVAQRHLDAMGKAADRIERGIALLSSDDPEPMRAFRLMNRAMQQQRARQDWVRSGATGSPDDGDEQEWRPFQIAFILLNLPAISERSHPDRGIADLLWFPTGGGKTEAYLGLIAFTILHRRLKDREAQGVAAIMRYTLRLLTIQQFERAAMLLCSLESLRNQRADLGSRAFSIGLWVGQSATPNTLDDARAALNKLGRGQEVDEGNPIQIVRCPWCGTSLTVDHYRIVTQPARHLRIACGADGCDFKDGLPVHVVDEDVYRERPELLVGTVDKFARMAWTDSVRRLFGRDGQAHQPDLVIQDELHLISGPLGSMVGLYETAVDAACRLDPQDPFADADHKAKIIASTATIRRAKEQVRAVFNREAAQFPPPGLDPDRSFFARPAGADELGTRRYVGVMAPGSSHQTLMIRVYASLLQSAAEIAADDETRDPYWTLIGYFSSLRVLGSAYLQVQDDVKTRLEVIAGRSGVAPRPVRGPSELTSRVRSREIPEQLKRLEESYPSADADDVVLATNMISVGVDVDRLGLMAVMGQPQSSAEYIQATSRVGRKHPGLVVTILNSARSRDRSHFENFVPFHESIYRAVEATSATPFAARARDRGLHGVLVSLTRLLFADLAPGSGAQFVDGQEEKLRRAADIIVDRALDVSAEAYETRQQLDDLLQVWLAAARDRPGLAYYLRNNPDASLLIDPADALVNEEVEYDQSSVPWPTLQSLRDVDAESTLFQIPLKRSAS